MVLSVPNNEAIAGLRDDDVVEITCDIRSDGAHPVRIGAIDEFQLQQIKRLKYFERCTIQAILEDDRDAAVKGLALHPLVNEQAVDWLLAEDSGLERLVQWQTPHDHPWLEGMFAARRRRRGLGRGCLRGKGGPYPPPNALCQGG